MKFRHTVAVPLALSASTRRVVTTEPVDPAATLGVLQRGSRDPVHRRTPDGAFWFATRMPTGPATVRVTAARPAIQGQAWGPGAEEVLDRLPALTGLEDDPTGFEPGIAILERLAKRFAGWRICKTLNVWEALVPAVLEQKVTSHEAWRSWRELTWRFGERAPTPAPEPGSEPKLWVPPDATTLAALPSWEWHRAGVGPDRMKTLIRCARVASRLQESVDLPHDEAEKRLRVVPGVGIWTAAEVMQRAHGSPDAVSVGDFHLSKVIGWALERRPFDDEEMLTVLERWRGHRYRVTKLIELSGVMPPRRGPRFAGRDYRTF